MAGHRKLTRSALDGLSTQLRERRRLRRGGLAVRITVHQGADPDHASAREVHDSFVVDGIRSGRRDVQITVSGGLGPRGEEPLVTVESVHLDPVTYRQVDAKAARAIFRHHAMHGEVLADQAWVWGWPPRFGEEPGAEPGDYQPLAGAVPHLTEHSWFTGQHPSVLRRRGRIDPGSLEDALALNAYQGLSRALFDLTPAEILVEVARGGLRGRGFDRTPVADRWAALVASAAKGPVVVCHAAAVDAGDLVSLGLLENDPHSVIEGMAIAGLAVGAQQGLLVCPGTPMAAARLESALRQAENFGLIGERILGTGFQFHVRVITCAEAFPGDQDATNYDPCLRHGPETFANLGPLLHGGVAAYRNTGLPRAPGTKVLSLGGRLRRCGLVEVPLGSPVRRLVEVLGGGLPEDEPVKAVHLGGSGGGLLPARFLDLPLDPEALQEAGVALGTGSVMVLGEADDLVGLARLFLGLRWAGDARECPRCRAGSLRLLRLLDRISTGAGDAQDVNRLEEVARGLCTGGQCPACSTLPGTVLSTLRYFRSELDQRVGGRAAELGL